MEEPETPTPTFKDRIRKGIDAVRTWKDRRKHRITFDILRMTENGVPERFRQRSFDIRELPRDAVPVTNRKKTWCLVQWEAPPEDPSGGNAIALQIWADNNAFIRALTGWGSKMEIPWKAILIGAVVVVAVIWFVMKGGLP